ncbi:MAG: hypothetical protein V1893_02150, partial [Candidatus Omnitrophota bacterium]
MASQIVLAREFFVVFHGNELSIGLFLGVWLMLGAIGAGLFGHLTEKITHPLRAISVSLLSVSVLLPVSLIFIRSIRHSMGVSPAETLGIIPILVSAFFTLCLLGSMFGFLFALSCKACQTCADNGSKQIGYVYMLEALGATIGGLLVSLLLMCHMNALSILAVLSALNLGFGIYLKFHIPDKKSSPVFPLYIGIYI